AQKIRIFRYLNDWALKPSTSTNATDRRAVRLPGLGGVLPCKGVIVLHRTRLAECRVAHATLTVCATSKWGGARRVGFGSDTEIAEEQA
ncbi:MAG: hypothetical protein ACPHQT_09800, partial [Planctomycetota bacterium]